MNSRRRSIWLLLGLVAATGAGLSLAPTPAAAQILDRPAAVATPQVRPTPAPDVADPSLSPNDQSVIDSGWAADARPRGAPGTSVDTQDGIDPQQAASQDAEAQDGQDGTTPVAAEEDRSGDTDEFGEARIRPRQLPPQDGDLPTVIEAPPVPNRWHRRPQHAERTAKRGGRDACRHAQRARPRHLRRYRAELRSVAARGAGDEPGVQRHRRPQLRPRSVRAARHTARQLPPVHVATNRR